MADSDIASIREQIAREYESVNRVFHGFTPTAQHLFLTRRQENIARCFEALQEHVSLEEAMSILLQVEDQIASSSSSHYAF
jgi:hypothetical protein